MEKKEKKKGQVPVHVVRKGAVAASIWMRMSQTGFVYYDYSLSRSWKSESSGREGYSNNFFPQNENALAEVIEEASAWIQSKTDPAQVNEPAKQAA